MTGHLRGDARKRDDAHQIHHDPAVCDLIERERRAAAVEALVSAASDPALRLSGHSGISIRRLRDRADRIERGDA